MRKKKNDVKWNEVLGEVSGMKSIVAEQIGEFRCRMCGETVPYPYDVSSIMYGSPIVVCPRCKGEHLIYGRLEPALDKRYVYRYDLKFCLKVVLVSFVVTALFFVPFALDPTDKILSLTFRVIGYPLLFLGVTCLLFIDAIRNEKKFHTMTILKKSRMRMKNMDYVGMLLKLGYDVPKKYRPKHYTTPPLFKPKK